MKRLIPPITALLLCSCQPGNKEADLPDQPDRWLESFELQTDSAANHVEKGLMASSSQPVKDLVSLKTGDVIAGVTINAIKCSFHPKDASYSGQQYMWRGRWACLAGQSADDLAAASKEETSRLLNYIHVAPVTLP